MIATVAQEAQGSHCPKSGAAAAEDKPAYCAPGPAKLKGVSPGLSEMHGIHGACEDVLEHGLVEVEDVELHVVPTD